MVDLYLSFMEETADNKELRKKSCGAQVAMKESEEKYSILTCYYRPKPGGFCKRLFRAIDALLTRGHTVHYLAVVQFPIDHPNCHFHRFPWPSAKTSGLLFWGTFYFFAPILLLFFGLRYRTNRLFAFGYTYSMFLQPLRFLKRVPLTLFLRGDSITNHRIKKASPVLIMLELFMEGIGIYKVRLYGVSETLTHQVIARHRFLAPLISGVLRNDVPKKSNHFNRRKVSLPLHFGCVGVLARGKNQIFLLEVMEKIPKGQAELFLYGVGCDESFLLKKVQEKNLIDRVHFMGWVDSDDIWPNIDLLLMPSLHEGAPNAVLEAIGYGVPILASNIPEHTEILPGKDLLPLGKEYNWTHRLKQIIDDPQNQLNILTCNQKIQLRQLQFPWDRQINAIIVK